MIWFRSFLDSEYRQKLLRQYYNYATGDIERDETNMNITVVIFALCSVLAVVLGAMLLIRRYRTQLAEKMEKLKLSKEKRPRFRKRDKVAFYGRKLLRKVAESVEQKKRMIPRKRTLMRSNTSESYMRREPSDYFLDPELAKLRHRSSVHFMVGTSSSMSDEIPMEMFYLLKSVRVFGYLERPLFLELFKFIETKHIAAGLYLFNIGDPDDTIYVVQSGKIVVSIRHQEKEWPVKEATNGESIYSLLSFIGNLTGREERMKTVSARAVCDSTVVKMPFSAFIPVFEKYPETMIRVIQVIMVRMQRVTFATLHDQLGLCEELMYSAKPNMGASNSSGTTSGTVTASGGDKSGSNKDPKIGNPILKKSPTATHLTTSYKPDGSDHDSSNASLSPYNLTPSGTPKKKVKVKKSQKERLKSEESFNSGDSEGGSRSRDVSPKMKWSSVTFDPAANNRGTLLDNDEFKNVMDRARLERLESASKMSNNTHTHHASGNDELFADELNFYKPGVSPRQTRSHSLTYSHNSTTLLQLNKSLKKKDVTENVYIEAAQLFAKALGLPTNKSYLLNDKLQLHNCTPGAVLLEAGAVDSSVVLVLTGQILLSMKDHENMDVTVYTLERGETAGLIPVITGEPNMFSLKAKTISRVVVLSKEYFYELVSEVPTILPKVSRDILETMSPFVRQADFSLDWMQMEAGKSVYRQGDRSEATYLVINGRLRSVWQNVGATRKELEGEYGRGDLVGMVELLTKKERKTTVHAVRDTELAVIPVGLLDFMKAKYPGTVARLIQILSQKMMNQHEDLNSSTLGLLGAKTLSNISTVAIVPSNDSVPLAYFTMELLWCMNAIGPSIRLTSSDIVNKFGETAFDMVNDYKLSNFLSQIEDHHRLVVYQTDKTLSSWTQRCIRQADCIIILAVADQDPKVGEIEKQVDRVGVRAQKELVLLYRPIDPNSKSEGTHNPPRNTAVWLNNRDWVTMHHHIRCKNRIFSRKTPSKWVEYYTPVLSRPPDKHSDFSRLARHLTGTSIGLILGGGGARGAAHLGILKALQENDIPVDMVGGTSIGSMVGAIYAMYRHKPLESFVRRTREWFLLMSSNLLKVFDLTYPHTSFFSGKIFNHQIRAVFHELQIEDLWIPYFCVTTDISMSCIRIHSTGDIWRYVRSSMSLSGYLPPLCDPSDGHLLLDGGYVNNLPADIMKELWNPRRVIAVDVGSQDSQNLTNYGDYLSGWWVLANKWNPFPSKNPPIRVPGMEEIQSRLAYVLCKKQLEEVKNSPYCDYVRPPIDKYKTLSFGLFDEIYQLGYDHAAALFQQWVKGNYLSKLLDTASDSDDLIMSASSPYRTRASNSYKHKYSMKESMDEFAQVASRISRQMLSDKDNQFSTAESSDEHSSTVFTSQGALPPFKEESNYYYTNQTLPHEEDISHGDTNDNRDTRITSEKPTTSGHDTIESLPRQGSNRNGPANEKHAKFARGNAGRTNGGSEVRNRFAGTNRHITLMESTSFGEGNYSANQNRKKRSASSSQDRNEQSSDDN